MDGKFLQELVCRESFLAMGFSSPNPPVVAILETSETGELLGYARTQKTGFNHAERELYKQVFSGIEKTDSNYKLPAHNLYVTLQPCTHHGRTPPCSDLILEMKPSKLLIGFKDPNPLVQEKSDPQIYLENSIEVKYLEDLKIWSQCYLIGFFTRIIKKRPRIILKSAVTKEGYFSGIPPKRQPISSQSSHIPLSLLRAKVDAILVGPKTIHIDEPSLNFRIQEFSHSKFSREKDATDRNGIFWDNLLEFSNNEVIVNAHKNKIQDYQPIRVFLLGREDFHSQGGFKRFIQKQSDLVKEYPNTKVLFFTIEPKDTYSDEFIELLQSIPNVFIEYPGGVFSIDVLLESLAGFGINNLLVEGGNYLYESIFSRMDEDDDILSVTNTELSWESGIRPVHLQSEDIDEVWSCMVEKDYWKVYKKRRNTCLPD